MNLKYSHTNSNYLATSTKTTIEHFRKRWKNEYLTSPPEFHRATARKNYQNIKVGDLVQLEDDSPRTAWRLAKLDALLTGKDGMIRAVKLRTSYGCTNRPLFQTVSIRGKLFRGTTEVTYPKIKDIEKISEYTSY